MIIMCCPGEGQRWVVVGQKTLIDRRGPRSRSENDRCSAQDASQRWGPRCRSRPCVKQFRAAISRLGFCKNFVEGVSVVAGSRNAPGRSERKIKAGNCDS